MRTARNLFNVAISPSSAVFVNLRFSKLFSNLLTFIIFKIHYTILQGIQKHTKTGPYL
ncbi:hypothetical protein ALC57_06912 [Trachymyrmex cornetzi]|uniref:Uncharacterized protein n=1 Tax=Trachymyrmex cornetzi TaxID=471704 RepID=A0A195E851_9HYME|nr:hypothetical protein ALC57_06912 [Trachymyrmex cornetzi]